MANQEKIAKSEKRIHYEDLDSPSSHHEELRRRLDEAEIKHRAKGQDIDHIKREAAERAHAINTVTQEQSPTQKRSRVFTKQQRDASFNRQMHSVELELRPSEKRFSRFIHTKAIEKTSDIIGSTIARPNALLAGSITAFLLVTIIYLTAKHYGYQLSGFETIGAFILGWLLGIAYDYIRLLVSGKK